MTSAAACSGEDLHEQIRHFMNDVIGGYVDAETAEGFPDDWDLDRLWTALKTLYPVSVTPDEVNEAAGGRGALTADILLEELLSDAHHAYDARELLGAEVMREVERRVVLSVLDRKWREHLYEMDYLQEGIGLRAMAQRDPLVEYQREGFQLFQAMMESIKESVGYLFNVNVEVEQPTPAPAVAPMSVTDMLAGSGLAGAGTADAPAAEGAAAAAPAGRRGRGSRGGRGPAAARAAHPGQGPGAADARLAAALLRPDRRGRGRGARRHRARNDPDRRAARGHAEERAVPLRVRQEVQDVSRRDPLTRRGSH